ncbi:MAG TPA: adenosylcobinamide-phosphate synthase CbiB [Nitrospiraceae bacterium]|nr:adenosylcobinamide-phosphate synthase CbiB [Nitrospiraceae bacterium]
MTGSDLLLAAGLDIGLGDPRWLPHPVRGMGRVISWCDKYVRSLCHGTCTLRLAGISLAVGLPILVYALGAVVIEQAGALSTWLGNLVTVGLAFTTLAGRDLLEHVRTVNQALLGKNLAGARDAVSMIVGRDTEQLSESEVVRATVETIAESTSDGVIAPLIYLTVGGAPLALAYKAINTLDSMVGHRDAQYVDFGWASARLDDLANWIPARVTAGLIVLAAGLVTGRWTRTKTSWRILCRDGHKHASPNSGRPEAAMAGALGLQLGGINFYDGLPLEHPTIGEGFRVAMPHDIDLAVRIMVATSGLGLFLAVMSLWVA